MGAACFAVGVAGVAPNMTLPPPASKLDQAALAVRSSPADVCPIRVDTEEHTNL